MRFHPGALGQGLRPLDGAIFRTGASRASSGGGIGSRLVSQRARTSASRAGAMALSCGDGSAPDRMQRRTGDAGPRRARHLVHLLALAVRHHGLAGKDRDAREILSHHRPRDRPGHHLLLGRAHDHGGLRVHGRDAVPECLFHRHHPRQTGAQDVEVPRQFARSARPHRQVRRRRAALRRDAQRAARAGHPLRRKERGARPQLLHEALERRRFRQMQGGETEGEISPALLTSDDKWILLRLDAAIAEVSAALEEYRFTDADRGALSLLLERVLRLVSRGVEGVAQRRR